MVRILIVDDSEMERFRIEKLLETTSGHELLFAENGQAALELIEAGNEIDLVLTDIFMPEFDGMSLLDAVVQKHSQIPVILMTAKGNEELAVEALVRGAANYVTKRSLESSLSQAIDRVLTRMTDECRHRYLMSFLRRHSFDFELDNDREHIPSVISFLQGLLSDLNMFPRFEERRIGIAVQEAMVNAMVHGNLEVSSSAREGHDPEYERLIHERLANSEFAQRRVRLTGLIENHQIQFTICDEGPGFDPESVPDPTLPDNILKSTGRGLLMMKHFMDEVVYNDQGNEVRLVKRCVEPSLKESKLS